MKKLILILLFGLVFANFAFATTSRKTVLKCPVCGIKCDGLNILSTNTFGGQDRDFLRRANGGQTILLMPTTCPDCHFSGYVNDFEKPSISDDLKKRILKEKVLKVPDISKSLFHEDGRDIVTEGYGKRRPKLPSWAITDLIVQLMQLEKKPSHKISWKLMTTAWCVRFEENPFAKYYRKFSKKDFEWLTEEIKKLIPEKKTKDRNAALEDIEVASVLLKHLDSFPEDKRFFAAFQIGYRLRTHGEHNALLKAMPKLKPYFEKADWDKLEKQVKNSIELERKYLQQAFNLNQKILEAQKGKQKLENGEMPITVLTYLQGEISRRLGDNKNAIKYFNAAEKLDDLPDWLNKYIKEQKNLTR